MQAQGIAYRKQTHGDVLPEDRRTKCHPKIFKMRPLYKTADDVN